MTLGPWTFLAMALVVTLAACQRSGRSQERASLVAAVERFQRAENAARPARAAELRALTCTDPDVQRACDACKEATTATAHALELKSEVERALQDLGRGVLTRAEAEARHLDEKLAESMDLLERGRATMATCEARLDDLTRSP